jgi:hypothetical protein
MSRQLVPARDRAMFPVLVEKAENHWREHNPKLVALLEREGKLKQRLEEAAEHYIQILDQEEENGLHPLQAKELAAKTIYLPPEDPEA